MRASVGTCHDQLPVCLPRFGPWRADADRCVAIATFMLKYTNEWPCRCHAHALGPARRRATHVETEGGDCWSSHAFCSHLYQAETGCRPSTKYLNEQHGPSFQPDQYLDVSMRTTAVSWLVEVGMDFGLHQESLFLAVALLDRYLTATEVRSVPSAQLERAPTISQPADLKMFTLGFFASQRVLLALLAHLLPSIEHTLSFHDASPAVQGVARNDLQLISVACMLVAAKHEEVSRQICHAAANQHGMSCRHPRTGACLSRCVIVGTPERVIYMLQERHPSMAEFAGIADDSFQVLPCPLQCMSACATPLLPCHVCLDCGSAPSRSAGPAPPKLALPLRFDVRKMFDVYAGAHQA